jgi:CheY-like chemotaxis protein
LHGNTTASLSGSELAIGLETIPMNILLVEDDLVNQKIATQLLSKWGIAVTVAHDGIGALDVLREKTFNLVLMDINMPVMDGCEATTQIRADDDPYYQGLPILAYTASALADTKEKAEKLGMNDFISKPLNAAEMHCKINQYILPAITEPRPLNIRLELYTDNDPEFQQELVLLMISNLRELQHAAYKSYYASTGSHFNTIAHKVKSTIIILDDTHIEDVIESVKEAFTQPEKTSQLQENINGFTRLSESIIKALNDEVKRLQTEQ